MNFTLGSLEPKWQRNECSLNGFIRDSWKEMQTVSQDYASSFNCDDLSIKSPCTQGLPYLTCSASTGRPLQIRHASGELAWPSTWDPSYFAVWEACWVKKGPMSGKQVT